MGFKEIKRNKKLHLLAAAIFILISLFAFFTPLLLWDENAYLGNARSHLGPSNFTEDFRFPLLEWFITLIWIFGESILAARFLIILFAIGTIYLVYVISKSFFDKDAFLIAFFYSLSFPFLFWSSKIYTEVPSLFLVLLSFYFLTKESKKETMNFTLAGAFAGIAFLFKFPLALFALSVGLFLLYRKEFKKTFVFSSAFLIVLMPWLAINYIYHGNPIWDFYEQYKIVAQYTRWQPISFGIKNLFYSLGAMLALLPIGLFSFAIRKDKWNKLVVLYVSITLFYFLFFVNMKDIRYFFYILPFMIIIAFDAIRIAKKLNIKKTDINKILKGIMILSALISLIYSISVIYGYYHCDNNSAILQEIDYLKDKTNTNDTLLSNHWPWLGYYLNTKVASIWSSDAKELISTYNPKYFIVNDKIGDPIDTSMFNQTNIQLEKVFLGACGEKSSVYLVKQ